jgi:adenylate cyclase
MEPITPPGLVYVTEQFAASMILEHGHLFAADYAGIRPAAKGYGDMRMYRLRRKS